MSTYLPGCRIVGLDIGAHAIKAVQLTTSLTSFAITGFLVREHRVSTWEELSQQLRSLIQEGVLQGDLFVTSFPSHQVLFRNTEMPFVHLSKIGATIRFEAESLMTSPLEGMIVDFAVLERTPQGSAILIACVQGELLRDYMDALDQGGVVPDTVDIDSLALARLMAELKEKRTIGLLDIGYEKVSVGIYQGGILRLTRTIPLEAEEKDGMEGIRPALDEVIFTLKAHQGTRGGTIEELWLTGGGSRREGLGEYLETGLGVKVGHPDFFGEFLSHIPLPEEADLLGGVALGLALRGLRRERGRVDLAGKVSRPAQTFPPELRKKIIRMVAAGVFLVILIGANFYLGGSVKERRYKMLKGEIRRTFTETFPEVRGVVNELQQAQELVKGMAERGMKIGPSGRGSPLEIIREIAQRLPQGAKIVELNMDEERVALRGMAPSFAVVDEVKEALTASALFQDVKVGNVEIARQGGEGVTFQMVLARGGK